MLAKVKTKKKPPRSTIHFTKYNVTPKGMPIDVSDKTTD